MLQDVLIGLREELRQTLDLDHQTRKALRHAGNPKRGKWGRKGGRILPSMMRAGPSIDIPERREEVFQYKRSMPASVSSESSTASVSSKLA
jgi:hypothetical protein